MALPDYSYLVAGTPITWKDSGGTYAMTLASLASAAARQGPKSATLVDGTYGMPELLEILLLATMDVAAANGTVLELYLGESSSATAGTDNPGNLSGTDAALSNPSEYKLQLDLVGSLNLSNARGTSQQAQRFRYFPTCPYIMPVLVNLGGQALDSAGNEIRVTPYYRTLAD